MTGSAVAPATVTVWTGSSVSSTSEMTKASDSSSAFSLGLGLALLGRLDHDLGEVAGELGLELDLEPAASARSGVDDGLEVDVVDLDDLESTATLAPRRRHAAAASAPLAAGGLGRRPSRRGLGRGGLRRRLGRAALVGGGLRRGGLRRGGLRGGGRLGGRGLLGRGGLRRAALAGGLRGRRPWSGARLLRGAALAAAFAGAGGLAPRSSRGAFAAVASCWRAGLGRLRRHERTSRRSVSAHCRRSPGRAR